MTRKAALRIAARMPDVAFDLAHPDWPQPVIEDRVGHWRISWPPPAKPPDGVVTVTGGGYWFSIDKCSGEVFDRHAYR